MHSNVIGKAQRKHHMIAVTKIKMPMLVIGNIRKDQIRNDCGK